MYVRCKIKGFELELELYFSDSTSIKWIIWKGIAVVRWSMLKSETSELNINSLHDHVNKNRDVTFRWVRLKHDFIAYVSLTTGNWFGSGILMHRPLLTLHSNPSLTYSCTSSVSLTSALESFYRLFPSQVPVVIDNKFSAATTTTSPTMATTMATTTTARVSKKDRVLLASHDNIS